MTTKKKMDSAIKQQLENDIMDKFPELAHRIGLSNHSYYKGHPNKELFHLTDKDKIYLYTPSYKLIDDEYSVCDDIELKLTAILNENEQLVVNKIDFEFDNVHNAILLDLVKSHKVVSYFSNFKELSEFVLERSDIVTRLNPTLSFNPEGKLIDMGVSFQYFDSPNSFASQKTYYTNSVTLYNLCFNDIYSIKEPAEALIFAKMFFLSIDDENFKEFFDCNDWIELYQKFREDSERMLSVYDMSRF